MSESADSIVYTMNPSKLLYFFDENKLTVTLLITVLSFRISEFIVDIYDHIFLPVLNAKVGEKKLDERYLNVFGIHIKFGKVCLSFIRIVVIMYLIYLFVLVLKKVSGKF